MLIKDGKATPASFKELTGLSRKYIIPLMEYFDMNKLTVRVGDHRILREKTWAEFEVQSARLNPQKSSFTRL